MSTERLLEYLINEEEPGLDKIMATRSKSGRLRLHEKTKKQALNKD